MTPVSVFPPASVAPAKIAPNMLASVKSQLLR